MTDCYSFVLIKMHVIFFYQHSCDGKKVHFEKGGNYEKADTDRRKSDHFVIINEHGHGLS